MWTLLSGAHAAAFLFVLPVPRAAWPSCLLAATLLSTLAACVAVAFSNPGFLPVGASETRTAASDGGWTNFCYSCRIAKPLRTKHCRTCNRCVLDFDHHCPWLNACVGRGNRASFYVFVSALLADATTLCALALYAALAAGDPSSSLSSSSSWLCTKLPGACHTWRHHPSAAAPTRWVLFGVSLALLLPLMPFWLGRTRNVTANLTTNERYNRRRYAHFRALDGSSVNPFDRGAAKNCRIYFCGEAEQSTGDLLLTCNTDEILQRPGGQTTATTDPALTISDAA